MKSSLAVVETSEIGSNVRIMEYSVIRPHVVIENDVTIHPFVVIEEGVHIGRGVEVFPGCYLGKIPKGAGATARPVKYEPGIVIGENCAIGPNAVIYYDVSIGSNTLLGDGASVREGCRVGSRCVIGRYVTLNYSTIVGDDTKIMDHSWLAGNMTVGSGVFISGGVLTANDNDMGLMGYEERRVVGPHIEDRVRIGAGAILLPDATLGHDALIAAGAVITKNIAAGDLMMGVPARSVKRASDREKPEKS